MARWTVACWRRWVWVLAAGLVVTALAAAAAITRLGVSTNTVDMLSPDLPFRQQAKELNRAFPELDDRIVAVVDAPTGERAGSLAADFASRLADQSGVQQVYRPGGPFLRRHAFYYLSPNRLDALVDRLASAQPLLAALQDDPNLAGFADIVELAAKAPDAAAADGLTPLLAEMAATARALRTGEPRNLSWRALLPTGPLSGTTPHRRFVLVTPELDYARLKPASTAIANARTAAETVVAQAGAGRIRLTGEAVIKQQEMQTVERSGLTTGLLSLGLVTLILLGGLRSARLVAASLTTLLVGLVWTAGAAALLVGELNIISVAFAVLFVGLGIDFAIHFMLRVREHEPSERSISQAGIGSGCAIVLSALCAAVGFLAFWPTDYRGLAELGLISAVGMMIAAAASVTLLPALLGLFGFPDRHEGARAAPRSLRAITARPRTVLLAAGLLGLIGGLAATSLRFDFNPMNLRPADSDVMQVFRQLAADPATTPYTIQVLSADRSAAENRAAQFREAGSLGQVRTLASYVPAQQERKAALLSEARFLLGPTVEGEVTPGGLEPAARTDSLQRLRAALQQLGRGRDGALAERALSLDGELAEINSPARIAELERRWTRYLPQLFQLLREALAARPFGLEDLPAELRRRWVSSAGEWRIEVRPAEAITTNAEIRAFAQTAQEITPGATGVPIVIDQASRVVIASFAEASAYAAVGIVVILAAALRSLFWMSVALAPLPLAAAMTLGTAGLLDLPLNFANIIVLPLLIGLTVSSSIHLVLRCRQDGGAAVTVASSTPRGVLLSVLTTLAAFGSLAISPHPGMSSMGTLLSLAVVYIVLAVLVALPALLRIAGRARDRHG